MKIGDQVLYKGRKGLLCDIVQWHTGKRYCVYMPHLGAVEVTDIDDLKLAKQKNRLSGFSVDASGSVDINDLSELEAKKLLKLYIDQVIKLQSTITSLTENLHPKSPKWLVDIGKRNN